MKACTSRCAPSPSHRRWGYKRARARSKGGITPSDATRSGTSCAARICGPGQARRSSAARTAARGFAQERRGSAAALGSPARTPGLPRKGSPAEGGFGPIPAPIAAPSSGDRIAIQVVTGVRHWDSLAADTDAVTLGKRSPGPTPGPSHSPTAPSVSAVPALIGFVSRPTHSPAVPTSSPPNVVSSCLTISACFFSLRVTLAANTAAEATMIARGT